MDVMRKLHSILSPGPVAANRSQSRPVKAEVPDPTSFAERLREASKTEVTRPQLTPDKPRTADVAFESPAPDIDLPAAQELPIEPVVVELRDTLESTVAREQERVYAAAEVDLEVPEPAVPELAKETVPEAPASPAKASNEPTPSLLPPIGVAWSSAFLRGSGATGLGIAGDDATTALDLVNKHEYYNNPAKYGLTLNMEARLFLDAVDKGYVPNTPEGLGTLLATLSKGTVGPNARPPEITAYFQQFFAAERSRINV